MIEAALIRLVDDVGVLAEDDVVRAFSILKATDLPSYLRLRHAAKKANHGCSVTVLDKLVRAELPASDDDASALDELVALARAQCQLHHDADRNAVAVIPMLSRREVWRVYSSGFEDWLTEQIVAALSAPYLVQAVWDRIRETRPEMSEPEVVLPMRNLAGLWHQLLPAEQCRLAQLLI